MTKNILKQGVLLELNFLQSVGRQVFLCPFVGRKKTKMIGYFSLLILMLCTAVQLIITLLSVDVKDWVELVNVAPNLGVVSMGIIKYTKIQMHKELYNDLFCHFRDDIWDVVSPRSKEQQKIIKKYSWVIMVINRFLIYYTIPVIILVNSLPYIVMKYENKVNGSNEYLYPFDGWYPFDKIKWYAAIYVWEGVVTAVVIFIFLFVWNVVHLSFILLISMELRIIGNQLENMISRDDVMTITEGRNTDEIHRLITRKLKVLIKKHYFLIRLSERLDYVLGDPMLLTYLIGGVFICLSAFTFTVVDNLYKSIRYLSMCVSLVVEIFNQCLIGQILSDHSVNLTEAIYSCNWIYANSNTKKILLLLMMRTQKPFVLTGNGYVAMNMNTFSAICSTSYQLFNLLRTMYL